MDLNTNSDDEEIDDGLRPVCLPEIESSYTNYTGVVTGWGATEEGGFLSNVLLQVCFVYPKTLLHFLPKIMTDNL